MFLSLFFLIFNLYAVNESELEGRFEKEIIPFFQTAETYHFTNKQNLRIKTYYLKNPKEKATIVIIPGRTESSLIYAELCFDLFNQGYSFFLIDHQGQGASDRLLAHPYKGHVLNFNHYVDDVSYWLKNFVYKVRSDNPLYLYSHSMGGAVSALYLSKQNHQFEKALFSAPMFQINTDPYPEKVALAYAGFLLKQGKGEDYAPGNEDPLVPLVYQTPFSRYEFTKKYETEVAGQEIRGPTVKWVYEAIKKTIFIDWKARKINIPVMILNAEFDQVVRSKRQFSFCKKTPECELKVMKGFNHNLSLEADLLRKKFLDVLTNYLSP